MNKRWKFAILWIVLILGGLSGISYHRQKYFEEHLENNINSLQKEKENELTNLEEKWESLDKSDPSKMCYYFRLETTYHYYCYLFQFYEYLKNKEKGNIIIGTFLTQANEGALLDGVLIIRVANSDEFNGWYSENTYCKIFLDYSQQYKGSNQTYNWEEFKGSKDYREYADELYHSLENKKEITLQDAYQYIEDLEETAAFTDPYRKALLQSYVYLTEIGYANFQTHKNQDEFKKAIMDAEVVYSVYRFSRYLETKETAITTLMPFQRGDIYVHSAILDLAIVFALSTILTFLIYFTMRKI